MNDASNTTKTTRREELLNAAGELLVMKPASSLAEIAAHAGIGKATLHRYFASRDALILALGYRALHMVTEAIAATRPEHGSALDALARIVEALIPLGDKLYFLLNEQSVDIDPAFREAERTAEAPVMAVIQRGQAEGSLRRDLSPDWLLHVMNAGLYAAWQSVHEGFVARRDAARLLITTLLEGMTPR